MQNAVTIERFDLSEKGKLLAFLEKCFCGKSASER